jgi:hypothetical protein
VIARAVAAVLAIAVAAPALAQARCAPRADVLAQLAARWGETPRAVGLTPDGLLVEVFASPAGSWTITATRADGRTCLMSSGEGYAAIPAPVPGIDG